MDLYMVRMYFSKPMREWEHFLETRLDRISHFQIVIAKSGYENLTLTFTIIPFMEYKNVELENLKNIVTIEEFVKCIPENSYLFTLNNPEYKYLRNYFKHVMIISFYNLYIINDFKVKYMKRHLSIFDKNSYNNNNLKCLFNLSYCEFIVWKMSRELEILEPDVQDKIVCVPEYCPTLLNLCKHKIIECLNQYDNIENIKIPSLLKESLKRRYIEQKYNSINRPYKLLIAELLKIKGYQQLHSNINYDCIKIDINFAEIQVIPFGLYPIFFGNDVISVRILLDDAKLSIPFYSVKEKKFKSCINYNDIKRFKEYQKNLDIWYNIVKNHNTYLILDIGKNTYFDTLFMGKYCYELVINENINYYKTLLGTLKKIVIVEFDVPVYRCPHSNKVFAIDYDRMLLLKVNCIYFINDSLDLCKY